MDTAEAYACLKVLNYGIFTFCCCINLKVQEAHLGKERNIRHFNIFKKMGIGSVVERQTLKLEVFESNSM